MAKKIKGSRRITTIECTECRNGNKPLSSKRTRGVYRYTTTKNRKNTQNRLEIKKFCPPCNQHTIFKEIK